MNKKDIIIIGCPRSGKTTLTNIIMENDSTYYNISLDSLVIAMKTTMLEIGINEKFFNDAQVICLGFPNATLDEILHNIRGADNDLLFSYTKKMDNDELKERISFSLKYSRYLQERCKKYGIPFFETEKDRKTTLYNIFNTLIKVNERNQELEH